MLDINSQHAIPQPQGFPRYLSARVALTFLAVVLMVFLFVATLLFFRAGEEREKISNEAQAAAVTIASAFDQEVAAVNYLLKGLSKSPALRTGDMKAFYDQLKETPVPDGAWLVLNDLEGQLLNTLRPFGTANLPKLSDFPNRDEALSRIRDRGWTVSGRMQGIVSPTSLVVALSLRIDGADGTMTNFLTTVLSDKRLQAILRDQTVQRGWMKGVLDRKHLFIVAARDGPLPADKLARPELDPVSAGDTSHGAQGLLEGGDERGTPVLIAYRYSPSTNWTAIVEVPLAVVNAPTDRARWQILGLLAFLLCASGLAAALVTRLVARPIDNLTRSVNDANEQVGRLSEQLLALQEEERRRIARELHDSTAQHLVAANFSLMHLEKQAKGNAPVLETCGRLEGLLDKALKELRIFTYLLHPPNLAEEGLRATLQEFVDGFAARTGMDAVTSIPDGVNGLPFELQRCILRVVQEALGNVSRHADATSVRIALKLGANRLSLRIADNGRGIAPEILGNTSHPRLGVGIPGMRARLQQFGGGLKVFGGGGGTTVLAVVPLSMAAPPQIAPVAGTDQASGGKLSGFTAPRIRVLEKSSGTEKQLG
jgi:two-component system, NarL family, sensor kinase